MRITLTSKELLDVMATQNIFPVVREGDDAITVTLPQKAYQKFLESVAETTK